MRSEFTLIVSIPSRGSGLGKLNFQHHIPSQQGVSIPSRGSGLGKSFCNCSNSFHCSVSIPSRGSGLGKDRSFIPLYDWACCFNPLSGKWFRKVKKLRQFPLIAPCFNPLSGKWFRKAMGGGAAVNFRYPTFQSPLGEVVQESNCASTSGTSHQVSIPSRGSGLGKSSATNPYPESVSDAKSTH